MQKLQKQTQNSSFEYRNLSAQSQKEGGKGKLRESKNSQEKMPFMIKKQESVI